MYRRSSLQYAIFASLLTVSSTVFVLGQPFIERTSFSFAQSNDNNSTSKNRPAFEIVVNGSTLDSIRTPESTAPFISGPFHIDGQIFELGTTTPGTSSI